MFVLLLKCVLVWLSWRQLAGLSSVLVFWSPGCGFERCDRVIHEHLRFLITSILTDVCCMYRHSFHTLLQQQHWNTGLRNNLYDCSMLIIAHLLHCVAYNYGHLSCSMLLSSRLLLHLMRKCSLVSPLSSFHDISLPSAHSCCLLLNFLIHSVLKRLLIWLHWVI